MYNLVSHDLVYDRWSYCEGSTHFCTAYRGKDGQVLRLSIGVSAMRTQSSRNFCRPYSDPARWNPNSLEWRLARAVMRVMTDIYAPPAVVVEISEAPSAGSKISSTEI